MQTFTRPILPDPPPRSALLSDAARAGLESGAPEEITRLAIFHGYMGVFVIAFLVTLFATPFMRRLAVANGVIDRPNDPRKIHRIPVAYLGGVAVFLGMLAGVAFAILTQKNAVFPVLGDHALAQRGIPLSVLLGLTIITLAGLLDDVVGVSPRIKIAMQLIAAAALALDDVGVRVAQGVLGPIGALFGNERLFFTLPLHFLGPEVSVSIDLIYWAGTAIIAVFILGACNASNLIDGLDGLCSGVTAIAAAGLLVIALSLALIGDGPLDSSRITLCLCLLGATLGFLPHNFNPATIFLGDCGSMLMGFSTIVIILSLGDTGKTPLVVAGLIIYMLPMIDTTLAIVRRKMAGRSLSAPDDQHLHHLLKRALGVRGAVFVLYGIAAAFAILGVVVSLGRARVAYAIALVMVSYIGVTAVKIARRKLIEEQAAGLVPVKRPGRRSGATPVTPTAPAQAPARTPASPVQEPEPRPV